MYVFPCQLVNKIVLEFRAVQDTYFLILKRKSAKNVQQGYNYKTFGL